MKTIEFTAKLTLSDDEAKLLAEVLDCEIEELQTEVSRYAPAAVREQLDMFMGIAAMTSVTDLRERRLVGLIQYGLDGAIPGPDLIARLFNITQSMAKTLLRSVAAKHRVRLREFFETALKEILEKPASDDKGNFKVLIVNPVLRELLDARLASASDPKTPLKPGDSLTLFTIDKGSYEYLQETFEDGS